MPEEGRYVIPESPSEQMHLFLKRLGASLLF